MERPIPRCALVTGYGAVLADGECWPGRKGHREEMRDKIINEFTVWWGR